MLLHGLIIALSRWLTWLSHALATPHCWTHHSTSVLLMTTARLLEPSIFWLSADTSLVDLSWLMKYVSTTQAFARLLEFMLLIQFWPINGSTESTGASVSLVLVQVHLSWDNSPTQQQTPNSIQSLLEEALNNQHKQQDFKLPLLQTQPTLHLVPPTIHTTLAWLHFWTWLLIQLQALTTCPKVNPEFLA